MIKNIYRILTFLISIVAISNNESGLDSYVILHWLIIAISSYSLFSFEDKPFSLYKMFHIFTLFFFGIAPIIQYYDQTRFLDEPMISINVKIEVSFVILITILMFNIIYYFVFKFSNISKISSKILKLTKLKNNKLKFNGRINFLLICLSLFSLFMLLYVNNFNFMKLLFKGGEFTESLVKVEKTEKSITLITNQFIRPITFIVFVISFFYNKKSKFINLILFIIFIITCSPTGLARNTTASYYMPLLLLFVPIFKRKHAFVGMMIVALLVIFPFLNRFRNFSANSELSIGLDFDMFTDLHFDAYMTFCRVVNLELITYGNQLLGVLFFFVPRSIWLNKPQSSGFYHADILNFDFKNLAMTFWAEGYINFGYFGTFSFLIFLGWFCGRLDKVFWIQKKQNSFFNILYVLILGMLLFILRGDLMNGFSYLSGLLLASFLVYKLILKIQGFKI